MADAKDCFRRLKAPAWLRPFFAWPEVPARALGLTELGGVRLRPADAAWPTSAPMSMGFARSLFLRPEDRRTTGRGCAEPSWIGAPSRPVAAPGALRGPPPALPMRGQSGGVLSGRGGRGSGRPGAGGRVLLTTRAGAARRGSAERAHASARLAAGWTGVDCAPPPRLSVSGRSGLRPKKSSVVAGVRVGPSSVGRVTLRS